MKSSMGWLVLANVLVTATGCFNGQPRPIMQSQPYPPPAPRPVLPVGPAPVPPPVTFQQGPPPCAAVPPGTYVPPVSPQANPFPTVPPAGAPQAGAVAVPPSEPITRVENRWQPGAANVQLGAPEPLAGGNTKAPLQFYPPDKTAEPPLNNSATALPVGIPQFATALDNVTVGLRPSLDDGLDWLKAHNYRTVVQVRLPGAHDGPDRTQVEKRGMKYMSLEVSPQTLNKETIAEFTRIARDTSGQPVFIYDRDGSLVGGLWYLYFRTSEQFADDVARIRAGALGLRENRDGGQRDMWLAIQRFLNDTAR